MNYPLIQGLSLTDLITLKQHLMAEENKRKLQAYPAEDVIEVCNHILVVEKEIDERIQRIFA